MIASIDLYRAIQSVRRAKSLSQKLIFWAVTACLKSDASWALCMIWSNCSWHERYVRDFFSLMVSHQRPLPSFLRIPEITSTVQLRNSIDSAFQHPSMFRFSIICIRWAVFWHDISSLWHKLASPCSAWAFATWERQICLVISSSIFLQYFVLPFEDARRIDIFILHRSFSEISSYTSHIFRSSEFPIFRAITVFLHCSRESSFWIAPHCFSSRVDRACLSCIRSLIRMVSWAIISHHESVTCFPVINSGGPWFKRCLFDQENIFQA